jgi:hypothetical protein
MTGGHVVGRGDPLDLGALNERAGIADVEAYYRRNRIPRSRRWWWIASFVAVYLTAQAVLVGMIVPIAGLAAEQESQVSFGFLAATGAYASWMMLVIWRNAARPTRVDRAARANGFDFTDRAAAQGVFLGTLAGHASSGFVTDVVSARGDRTNPHRAFTAASIAPRLDRPSRRGGILQIPLASVTPHIVVENRRGGVLATTGSRIRAGQRLSLEGDFDRTFTLYCPAGYETDALYIFAPDLMALMLDLAGDCDAELIDGAFLVYSRRPWRLWRPDRFAALIALVDTLGAKARRQTGRYVDRRGQHDGRIAPVGRRLKLRPSTGAVLAALVPMLFTAFGVWGVVSQW